MKNIFDILAKTPSLVFLFIAQLLIGGSFFIVQNAVGGSLLDTQMNAQTAFAVLQNMSDLQKHYHIIATSTLDMIYPIVYGGLLAGIVWRFADKKKTLLIIPAIIAIFSDIIENIIQIIALSGNDDFLYFKNFITPIKYGMILFVIIIAALLIVKTIIGKSKNDRYKR